MNKNRSISLILLIAVYIILFIAVIALLHERNLQIKLILLITSLTFIVFSKLLRCSGKVNWLTSYDNEEYKNMTENTRLEIALKYSKIISIPNIILCCYLIVSFCLNINIFVDVICFLICLLTMCTWKIDI